MPIYYEWFSNKHKLSSRHEYPSFEVSSHPLKSNVVPVNQSPSKNFMANLNKWSSALDQTDPLLRFEQMDIEEPGDPIEVFSPTKNYLKAWTTKKSNILHKYTTVEKLTIVSSFLPGDKALIRQVSNLNEKLKHRLEQLDEVDEGSMRKTMGLTQQEYITKIKVLNDEIKKAWDSEQRVKAFKIAIQCSKLLADTNVMHFYPSKFVLITDILDNFGDLVFCRLKEKSSVGGRQFNSNDDIDSHRISEVARETCLNWMYKMASIRELLPRLYMEICLLKCYVFKDKNEIKPTIERLTLMIRGVADPVVSVYLRMYLCRVASLLTDNADKYFYDNLTEFIDDYEQIFHSSLKTRYECQSLTREKYLSVFFPAAEWLLHGALRSDRPQLAMLEELLNKCENMDNNELLLRCVLSAFDSPSIIKKSTHILEIIQKSTDDMVLIHEILSSLGEHLCTLEGYHQSSESLIQGWWKMASDISEPAHFLQVLEPWLEFACKHLSSQHVNMILRGSIRYVVKCGRPADDFSGHFQLVFKRMLKSIPDVEELLLMDAFMPLVELVQTSNARTLMAKTVLTMFFERNGRTNVEDPVVIACLMRLCAILHESINAVTVEDEVKASADLLARFVVAAKRPTAEQQLALYVECRGAFLRCDAALVVLVHAVNTLSASLPLSHPSTAWLQRACAAYCFITIPSLNCTLTKAQLYLLSGQMALLNNCIGQAEANFKALVSLLSDIPEFLVEDAQKKPTQHRVAGLISDFLSTLLILPDNADTNYKAYIPSGFIKAMERIHWRKTDMLYYNTLLHTLDLLAGLAQENYSYHIDSVISNDALYGSDPEFLDALDKYASNITQELLLVLKALAESNETKKQYNLCLELFWRVAARGDLQQDAMFGLAVNLWTLAEKLRDQDSPGKFAKSLILSLTSNPRPGSKRLLQKLKETANAT